jgi:hypothetical protein
MTHHVRRKKMESLKCHQTNSQPIEDILWKFALSPSPTSHLCAGLRLTNRVFAMRAFLQGHSLREGGSIVGGDAVKVIFLKMNGCGFRLPCCRQVTVLRAAKR